jgi:TPR repeat protein
MNIRWLVLLVPAIAFLLKLDSAAGQDRRASTAAGASAQINKVAQDAPVTDCDVYAASDTDPHRKALGVQFGKMDPMLAVPACESAVRQYPNSVRLAYQLGRAYSQSSDFAKAINQYQRAADAGYAPAQHNLGALYQNGQGVPKDYAHAVAWQRKAADQSYAPAQAAIGVRHLTGQGVPKDEALAVAWLRKAAMQGLASAQTLLGSAYQNGQGVVQNVAQAVVWYRKAAEHGDATGQFDLGSMYFTGNGVSKNETQAAVWMAKAAEQGFPAAQHILGLMYEKGEGVAKDIEIAVAWHTKAAEQGNEAAKKRLAELNAAKASPSPTALTQGQTQPPPQPATVDKLTRDIIEREAEAAGAETRGCIKERVRMFSQWGITDKDKVIAGVMNTCGAPFLVYGNMSACQRQSPICGNFVLQREMLRFLVLKELGETPTKPPLVTQPKEDFKAPAGAAQELAKIEKLKPVTLQARACIRNGILAAYQSGAYGHDEVISFFMSRCFGPFSVAYQQAGYPEIAEPGFRLLVVQEVAPQEWQRTLDDIKSGR